MIDQKKIDEKEARLLAEKEAQKYGFGSDEINKVLITCGTDKACIRAEFQKLNASKKFKEAAESFNSAEDNGPKL